MQGRLGREVGGRRGRREEQCVGQQQILPCNYPGAARHREWKKGAFLLLEEEIHYLPQPPRGASSPVALWIGEASSVVPVSWGRAGHM